MKMFAYTFKTWVLAQMLHPIVLLIYISIRRSIEAGYWMASAFFIFVFSIFASIPSLIIAWLLLYVLSNSDLSPGEKYVAWIVSVVGAIILNYFFLNFMLDGILDNEISEIITPAIIAGGLSTFIRARSFFLFQVNYTNVQNNKS